MSQASLKNQQQLNGNGSKMFEVYNSQKPQISNQNQSQRTSMGFSNFQFGTGLSQNPVNKGKLMIKNQKRSYHHQLKIRPDDDVSSQHSTLTFYQSSFPNESAQVIAKRKINGSQIQHPSQFRNQHYLQNLNASDSSMHQRTSSIKRKKEIIDEVKFLIASKKILSALKYNTILKSMLKRRLRQLAIEAQIKISRAFRAKYYRQLFKQGIFIATLYLETNEQVDRSKRVEVFGSFTKKPWNDKIQCKFDKLFKCFKADKVRIMIGHQFKFIINSGQNYINSSLYPIIEDSTGNVNNYYSPMRQMKQKPRKVQSNFIPHASSSYYQHDEEAQYESDSRKIQTMKYVQLENIQDMLDLENFDKHNSRLENLHQHGNPAHHTSSKENYLEMNFRSEEPNLEKEKQHQIFTNKSTGNNNSFINRPYQDFIGSFERYYLSYQVDIDKMYQDYNSTYYQQDYNEKQTIELTTRYSSNSSYESLKSISQHANLFDMDLNEEFTDLTLGNLRPISEVDERTRKTLLDIQEGFYTETAGDLSAFQKESSINIQEEECTGEICMITGAFKLGKVPDQCEDAYFVTERGFGVSDGVSGWNDYGFSSSAFANQLMDYCKSEIEGFLDSQKDSQQSVQIMKKMRRSGSYLSMENLDVEVDSDQSLEDETDDKTQTNNANDLSSLKFESENIILHPIYILEKAFHKVQAVGSSTALVGIRNQKEINIANLGDSGFVLIRFRNGEAYTAARSKEQQHSFNIPYQLSILPGPKELENLRLRGRIEELKKLKAILRRRDNMMCQDKPDDAEEYSFELQDGDIIVSATDGIFDNLFSHEILQIVRNFKIKHKKIHTKQQAEKLAEILVYEALDKVKDKKKKTPYQRKYKKTYNATWEGGKEDDMTVLVTIAVSKQLPII
eukprot:403360013